MVLNYDFIAVSQLWWSSVSFIQMVEHSTELLSVFARSISIMDYHLDVVALEKLQFQRLIGKGRSLVLNEFHC